MPNPRNRVKSTGDTHPPELGDDAGGNEDTLRFEPAEEEGRATTTSRPARPDVEAWRASGEGLLEQARTQVRQRPVAALAGAFVLGLLLARL